MPNHITNKLFIDGQTNRVAAVMDTIKSEYVNRDGETVIARIDFDKIIPMPPELDIQVHSGIEAAAKGDMAARARLNPEELAIMRQMQTNIIRHGAGYWYDWKVQHWGTKWGAYETPNERDTDDTIVFETAQAYAHPVFIELSAKWPDLSFWLDYADEDTGHNLGSVCFENGVMRRVRQFQDGTPDAVKFAIQLRYPNLSAEELRDWGYDNNYNRINE